MQLKLEPDRNIKLSKGKGCQACYDSGFKGRMGIYELVEVDTDLQRLILEYPSGDQLQNYVVSQRLPTILTEGIEKVLQGVTTFEEVTRAIHMKD